MGKIHVHVYELKAKAEFDVEFEGDLLDQPTDIEKEAMEEALALAKNGSLDFGEPDNRFLAIPFVED